VQQVVVGAVILDGGGRVLAARRHSPPELAGSWEFPGGKVEPGEADAVAVVREVYEELGVVVEVLERIEGQWEIRDGLRLRLFTARIREGSVTPGPDHDAVMWVAYDELDRVTWTPADRAALPAVVGALRATP
jgi:8-oxo-dGTP diphosphatase